MASQFRHFVVIGAQRSGSTFAYQLLDAHPEIEMAKPVRPEPKFFLRNDCIQQGMEHYRSTFFSGAGSGTPLYGEKSASYYESPYAARCIKALVPEADIVCFLRDPIERAISNVFFSQSNGLEPEDLDTALLRELDAPEDMPNWQTGVISVSPFTYLDRGDYARHLSVYRDCFSAEKLHVVSTESLTSNVGTIQLLFGKLGANPDFVPPRHGSRVNSSSTPKVPPRPQTIERLTEHFTPLVDNLAGMFELDTSGWLKGPYR